MTQARSHLATVLTILYASLTASCSNIGTMTADDDVVTRIQITSEPSGAEIYLMGTKAGVTPSEIRDRDIYPVSYKPEMEKYYGSVILRKEGCKEFRKRLTRKEVIKGLSAKLDCGAGTAKAIAPEPPPAAMPVTTPPPVLPEQQLEQLRTLQKLQEEGILSVEEEKKLRKRILDSH